MPDVRNWQLGRPMAYPYAEQHPRRQFAAVFNTNRCIACQTCTMACKSTWTFSKGQEYMWWNNVETKPYGGYPQGWDVKVLQLLAEAHARENRQSRWQQAERHEATAPYGRYDGLTVFEAAAHQAPASGHQRVLGYLPSDEEWRFPNLGEDTSTTSTREGVDVHRQGVRLGEHATWFFYLQRICNHCTYPACLAACPRQAIYKRPEDGVVLIDQERCRGYRKCVEACPYKKPMYRTTTKVSEKCVACYPRLEGTDPMGEGRPLETRCMAACVGRIRMQGLVPMDAQGGWQENPHHPLYFLVRQEQVALPLYPQFGTEPNVYYIPPRWVPRPYLRQMFGPGVDRALERYTAPSRELLAVLQLFRSTQVILDRFAIEEGPLVFETEINGVPWQLYNDTVIGFDMEGREVVRTTVEEPIFERDATRPNSI